MQTIIASALSSLAIAPPVVFRNLTMIPLVRTEGPAAPAGEPGPAGAVVRNTPPERMRYAVLDEALSRGTVEITETSADGSVPELRVVNRGVDAVLIVDGEELVGAKQNRVVNLTILAPPNGPLTIPVSCVEAGRWRARSRTFAAAPRAQYATGRAKRMAQVTRAMHASGERRADQADVWQDIAMMSARLGANSPTSAMEAIFDGHAPTVDAFVRGMAPVNGQVGGCFGVGDRILGLDVFDRPETLRALLPKLVRSAAIDAIDDAAGSPSDGSGVLRAVPAFLAALSSAAVHATPAVGLGQDVRLSASGLTGAALVVDDVVIHVSGFCVS